MNLWHRNSALSVTQLVLAISVTTIIIPSLHSRSHHIMVFSKNFSLHFSSSWQHAVALSFQYAFIPFICYMTLQPHVIIWFEVIQCLCFFFISFLSSLCHAVNLNLSIHSILIIIISITTIIIIIKNIYIQQQAPEQPSQPQFQFVPGNQPAIRQQQASRYFYFFPNLNMTSW